MAKGGRSKRTLLMVSTRKGAFLYQGDPGRRRWRLDGPHFLGCIVHHLVLDRRDGRTMLMATRTDHLGPVIMRSTDRGRTWTESKRPPAFAKAPEGQTGRVVDHTFWLSPGLASEPGVWWAGTSPHGLFRCEDGGVTWSGVEGFNRDLVARIGAIGQDTPDGAVTHSILVDPRDPKHLYVGLSGGGSFESRDGGGSRRPSCRTKTQRSARTRTPWRFTRSSPAGSTSRTTAASIVSTGLERSGRASV